LDGAGRDDSTGIVEDNHAITQGGDVVRQIVATFG
jgi:hypothetical protein